MKSVTAQPSFAAGIFDLDGVVTHTASLHAQAWKQVFDEFLKERARQTGSDFVPFDLRDDYLTYVDGKPRYQGVQSFLKSRGIELPFGEPSEAPSHASVCGVGNRKNELYNALIESQGVDVFGSTVTLIEALRDGGTRVGLMSSSKNTVQILRRTGLGHLFEARVDGVMAEEAGLRGKPHPDSYLKTAELLGVSPVDCFVVEDAVSGVEAGRRGGFGLVIGVDREGNAAELRRAGAHLVVGDLGELTVNDIDEQFARHRHERPSALQRWETISRGWEGKRVAVFLDYDGTLTPIVARPDLARISGAMKTMLRGLADVCPTIIVSGRGREDVSELVGLDNLYYAGSHGFDIAGPAGTTIRHEIGAEYRPVLEEVARDFEEQFSEIEGALIEDKKFSVAVHYRLVADENVPHMERAVDQAVARYPQLKKAHGKKVFEVRPQLEWDKGKAVLWLLQALDLDTPEVMPLYIGDDVTDEDAFAALSDRGLGILVAETPRETHASLSLRDTDEVGEFLQLVSSWQTSQQSGEETQQ
ncbi:MAG: trehalose-phosphatase [Gemmatimonadota bacterium]|nr:MAG: trehalose-phosphatase [Gemmatimonadota bacterium]